MVTASQAAHTIASNQVALDATSSLLHADGLPVSVGRHEASPTVVSADAANNAAVERNGYRLDLRRGLGIIGDSYQNT